MADTASSAYTITCSCAVERNVRLLRVVCSCLLCVLLCVIGQDTHTLIVIVCDLCESIELVVARLACWFLVG